MRAARPPGLSSPAFGALLAQALEDPELGPLLRPLAAVAEQLDRQVAELDRRSPRAPRPAPRADGS